MQPQVTFTLGVLLIAAFLPTRGAPRLPTDPSSSHLPSQTKISSLNETGARPDMQGSSADQAPRPPAGPVQSTPGTVQAPEETDTVNKLQAPASKEQAQLSPQLAQVSPEQTPADQVQAQADQEQAPASSVLTSADTVQAPAPNTQTQSSNNENSTKIDTKANEGKDEGVSNPVAAAGGGDGEPAGGTDVAVGAGDSERPTDVNVAENERNVDTEKAVEVSSSLHPVLKPDNSQQPPPPPPQILPPTTPRIPKVTTNTSITHESAASSNKAVTSAEGDGIKDSDGGKNSPDTAGGEPGEASGPPVAPQTPTGQQDQAQAPTDKTKETSNKTDAIKQPLTPEAEKPADGDGAVGPPPATGPGDENIVSPPVAPNVEGNVAPPLPEQGSSGVNVDQEPGDTEQEEKEGDNFDGTELEQIQGDNNEEYAEDGQGDKSSNSKVQEDSDRGSLSNKGGKFSDDQDSHFFAYFLTIIVTAIIFYLVFHNKQRIIALIIEGRVTRGGRAGRRAASRARYHKLDNNLEEAMTATKGAKTEMEI